MCLPLKIRLDSFLNSRSIDLYTSLCLVPDLPPGLHASRSLGWTVASLQASRPSSWFHTPAPPGLPVCYQPCLALRSPFGLKALRPFVCLPAFPLALQPSRPQGPCSTLLVDVSALGQMEKRVLKRGRSSFTTAPRPTPAFQPRCRGAGAPHDISSALPSSRRGPRLLPGANGTSGGSGRGRASSPGRPAEGPGAARTGHGRCPPPRPEPGHRPGPLPLSSERPRRPPARPPHPGPGRALALPWRRPPPPGPGPPPRGNSRPPASRDALT